MSATTSPSSAPQPQSGSRRRYAGVAVTVLPLLAVTGALAIAFFAPGSGTCDGAVPGCAVLSNVGETPVAVEALSVDADGEQVRSEYVAAAGARALLFGETSAVQVDAGQCLRVDGGPLWSTVSITDRVGEDTGLWYEIDGWGARVQLANGSCPSEG